MKAGLSFLFTLLISCAGLAQEGIAVPTGADRSGGLSYWLARKLVLDIDSTLKAQGINAEVCTYRNLHPLKDSSYKGIGPCLFENFKRSMQTEELVGVVYTWIKDKNGQPHPIEIRWRPPRGGWLKLLQQVVEMRFEKPLYKTRSFLGGEDFANQLRFEEFLVGGLNIILPDDPDALAAMISSGNQWAAKYASGVKDMDFKLRPTGVEEGKVVYQGQLRLTMKSDSGVSETNFDIKTNINVMVLDRKFYAKGHLESGSDSSIPLTTEGLP